MRTAQEFAQLMKMSLLFLTGRTKGGGALRTTHVLARRPDPWKGLEAQLVPISRGSKVGPGYNIAYGANPFENLAMLVDRDY